MKNTDKQKDIAITLRHMTARVDPKAYENIQEIATKLDRSFNWVVNKILLNAKIEDINRNS